MPCLAASRLTKGQFRPSDISGGLDATFYNLKSYFLICTISCTYRRATGRCRIKPGAHVRTAPTKAKRNNVPLNTEIVNRLEASIERVEFMALVDQVAKALEKGGTPLVARVAAEKEKK
jgi:hypothetical protein